MIGKLKGVIDSYGEDSIILDVNGVGYLVHCSARTLQELPRAGEPPSRATAVKDGACSVPPEACP
jgi:Holliday junction DNA helicase RuvA